MTPAELLLKSYTKSLETWSFLLESPKRSPNYYEPSERKQQKKCRAKIRFYRRRIYEVKQRYGV